MATLTNNVNATQTTLNITGDVSAAEPGRQYLVDDEVVTLRDFIRDPDPRGQRNRNKWRVTRGDVGTAKASHSLGAEIVAVADAYTAGTTLTPPDPFPAVPEGLPTGWTQDPETGLVSTVGYGLDLGEGEITSVAQLSSASGETLLITSPDNASPGDVHIRGGRVAEGETGTGAGAKLEGGASRGGESGGLASLIGGKAEDTGGYGGSAVVQGGESITDLGGSASLTLEGASSTGPGTGGGVFLSGGAAIGTEAGGSIAISGGAAVAGGVPGSITIAGASSGSPGANGGIGFNGASPSIPELPATPDAQDIADVLVALGLVTQAAP